MYLFDDESENFSHSYKEEMDDKINYYCRAIRNPKRAKNEKFDLAVIENLIDYCIDTERYEEALDLARHWLGKMPDSIDALIKKSYILLNLDRIYEAKESINKAIDLSPEDEDALLLKALILDYNSDNKDAMDLIQKLLSKDPDNDDFLYAYANILETRGDYQYALDIFLHLTENSDDFTQQLNQEIAFLFNALNQSDEAIEYYDKALEEDPMDHNIWYNIGVIHSSLKRYDKAIDAYKYAVAIDDDFFLAWYNMAHTYSDDSKLVEAIEAYNEALRIKPTDLDVLHNIASVYGELEKYEDSERLFKIVIDLYPNSAPSFHGIGLACEALNKDNEALKYFDRALKINNKYTDVHIAKALLFKKLENFDSAKKEFVIAVKISPNNFKITLEYIKFLFEKEDFITLEIFLLEILDQGNQNELKKHPEIYFFLSAIYAKNNDEKSAKKYFQEGLKYSTDKLRELSESLDNMMETFIETFLDNMNLN